MAETKPELADIPRGTGMSQYVPSGRRHHPPRRDPAATGEARRVRSLVAGGVGLGGQHR